MVEIPDIAGWPEESPDTDPTRAILILYNDLSELQDNVKIAQNEAWLHKFARNARDLDKILERCKESHDLHLVDMRNWFQNGKIKGKSLSSTLFEFDASDFTDISSFKKFIHALLKDNFESFEMLIHHFENYLKHRNF